MRSENNFDRRQHRTRGTDQRHRATPLHQLRVPSIILASAGVVKAAVGWLELRFGDIKGGQYIGRLAGEYITTKRWGFGAAINYSNVNVDWTGIDEPD